MNLEKFCSSIYLEQEEEQEEGFNYYLRKEREGGSCRRSGHGRGEGLPPDQG